MGHEADKGLVRSPIDGRGREADFDAVAVKAHDLRVSGARLNPKTEPNSGGRLPYGRIVHAAVSVAP